VLVFVEGAIGNASRSGPSGAPHNRQFSSYWDRIFAHIALTRTFDCARSQTQNVLYPTYLLYNCAITDTNKNREAGFTTWSLLLKRKICSIEFLSKIGGTFRIYKLDQEPVSEIIKRMKRMDRRDKRRRIAHQIIVKVPLMVLLGLEGFRIYVKDSQDMPVQAAAAR
jgi:hypothetical protein